MYINNLNIFWYVGVTLIGIAVGYFINILNRNFSEKAEAEQEVEKKNKKREKDNGINLLLLLVIAGLYGVTLYKFGISIETLKYLILTPLLISALIIDFKFQIIPNRLNLSLFQIGIAYVFLSSFIDLNIAIDGILGMVTGGGIFLLITLIGGIIAGKEAMGFGDVKLMGALGLFFGLRNIIIITVLSFLLGAIIGIIILIIKAKKKTEYMPFGPFIVIASIITIFVPQTILLNILVTIFSLGLNKNM